MFAIQCKGKRAYHGVVAPRVCPVCRLLVGVALLIALGGEGPLVQMRWLLVLVRKWISTHGNHGEAMR